MPRRAPPIPLEYKHPLERFQKLMQRRLRRVLLVASRYDAFLLGEDDRLHDLALNEFLDLSLYHDPWLRRVSTGQRALEAVRNRPFDVVVMTPHVRDMEVGELAEKLRYGNPNLALVPLAFDDLELGQFRRLEDRGVFERPFAWQGDVRLLLAILQSMEDRRNVSADTELVGVSVVILIEDNVHFYSSFLPVLYSVILDQSQRVISEGWNLQNKVMRMRARPKILHATTFEQALEDYCRYQRHVVGVISDIRFPRDGVMDPEAGIEFARRVRAERPDLPILLQSTDPAALRGAADVAAKVVLKGSAKLLQELTAFVHDNFGFGDFVFRMPNDTCVGRATNLREMLALVESVPGESLRYHAERHHFSTWLKARTEFGLADELRRHRSDAFDSVGDLRVFLVECMREFRRERAASSVIAFDPLEFHPRLSFARVGEGSLGGKARGLAFVRRLLSNYRIRRRFPSVEVTVPASLILATDVFDRFLERNELREFALDCPDDQEIERRFLHAPLPEDAEEALGKFVAEVADPLAVRSSSLLEDSQYVSFTGVYRTCMVPQCHEDLVVRQRQLSRAVKRVYASVYSQAAKQYIAPTPYRLEEEKMAVLIQRVLGRRHDKYFYPHISGVARSHNFYPVAPSTARDGIVTLALGLGEAVVGGGSGVSFSPVDPRHPIHFSTPDAILRHSQREFFALEVDASSEEDAPDELTRLGLDAAMAHGTLLHIGSVYDSQNHAVHAGVGRSGTPLVTFAGVLEGELFPLAELCNLLLQIGTQSMNRPVEIEFAVRLGQREGEPVEFAFLQMRPFVIPFGSETLDPATFELPNVLCHSAMVLGGGHITDVHDAIVVQRSSFDRSRSVQAAQDVGALNRRLVGEGRPYLLIGVGRWGASDPWLGIPVRWEQIAGARVIVEADLRDIEVAPSQGSHFFQNLTTSNVGYFTVSDRVKSKVDWRWLEQQESREQRGDVRWLQFEKPFSIQMDGRSGMGVITKPAG